MEEEEADVTSNPHCSITLPQSHRKKLEYRISGKFGGDLKLAVWQLQEKSPILMFILINNY